MESLESVLRRKDPDAKIFFAPKSLRAGGLWLPDLAREIAEATAFVLLVGSGPRISFALVCARWQRNSFEPLTKPKATIP